MIKKQNWHYLLERTLAQGFAVGAFNVDNIEIFKAICQAAKNKNSPVLVEVSENEIEFMGRDNMRDLVDNAKEDYGIEMYLNLDHGPSLEAAFKAIDAGYEFIHIDVSKVADLEQNIKITSEVVEYAHSQGAIVESEMEYFRGSSTVHDEDIDYEEIKKHFTDPMKALDFVKRTGIDTFAASVGNLHGLYNVPKIIDIDLLQEIRSVLGGYISLHGGSGTPDHYFKKAVTSGVSKININSEMRKAYRDNLEKALRDNPSEYAINKIEGPTIDAVQEVVEHHMDVFGSTGKAII